jgi:hypothetical protein
LRAQSVDLVEDHGRRPPAIGIAKVVLGAERAVVRAAARRLDLRAGTDRRGFEAMVVMMVAPDHLVRPMQRGLIDEGSREGAAIDTDGACGICEAETGKVPLAVREPQ